MTQAAILAASGSPGTTTGFKNRIINGGMVIDQRNAGAAVTPTASYAYFLDRWSYGLSQSSKLTFQQSTTAPAGFSNSLKVTVASAFSPGASDRFMFSQAIEGVNVPDIAWGTANAKSIAISFQVYSSITGTFSCGLSNLSGSRSYAFSYSIPVANTWTTVNVTVPGDTTGSWNLGTTSAAIYFYVNLGDGSNFLGAANTWSSSFIEGVTGQTSLVANAGATFYITGVQLEVGTTATNFDFRDYGRELILCQRYFESTVDIGEAVASGTLNTFRNILGTYAGAQYFGPIVFKVNKRAQPTITFYSEGNATGQLTAYATASSAAVNVTAQNIGTACLSGTTPSTGYNFVQGKWSASAEL